MHSLGKIPDKCGISNEEMRAHDNTAMFPSLQGSGLPTKRVTCMLRMAWIPANMWPAKDGRQSMVLHEGSDHSIDRPSHLCLTVFRRG